MTSKQINTFSTGPIRHVFIWKETKNNSKQIKAKQKQFQENPNGFSRSLLVLSLIKTVVVFLSIKMDFHRNSAFKKCEQFEKKRQNIQLFCFLELPGLALLGKTQSSMTKTFRFFVLNPKLSDLAILCKFGL